jgi:hypothetical protein
LSTSNRVFSYIHGESTRESQPVLKMHADVLAIDGSRDLPGLRYKIIRGVYDFGPPYIRKTSRTKHDQRKRWTNGTNRKFYFFYKKTHIITKFLNRPVKKKGGGGGTPV